MTDYHNNLAAARKSFLEALNKPETDTAFLRNFAKELRATQPELFAPYVSNDNNDPIKADSSAWNDLYFTQQKTLAGRNFSTERLEHLIQVRERFRQDGRKGFVLGVQRPAPRSSRETQTSYTPSVNLKKFADEGKLSALRMALIVELEDKHLDSQTLRSALAWTQARVPELCEPYSEKAFARAIVQDREKWTADYFDLQAVYLDTNFSEKRYLHLIDIREHLRGGGAKPAQAAKLAPATAPAAVAPRPSTPPRSAPAAEAPRTAPQASRPAPAPDRQGISPVLLAALLLGGALAAVAILILVLRK